jgi:hypothetical protein
VPRAGGSGDFATGARVALYLTPDGTQRSAVQRGAQSSAVFAKVACAAAPDIVDHDDPPSRSRGFPVLAA